MSDPFMIPAYTQETFLVFETTEGTEAIPQWVVGDLSPEDFLSGKPEGEPEVVEGKFWARLSAPGYMDSTDWSGPFESKEEAREHIRETWDVDPDTGRML